MLAAFGVARAVAWRGEDEAERAAVDEEDEEEEAVVVAAVAAAEDARGMNAAAAAVLSAGANTAKLEAAASCMLLPALPLLISADGASRRRLPGD